MNIEEKQQKRVHSIQGAIKELGAVCYTSEGAFYVQYSDDDDDTRLRKGVYRLENGGFLDEYNEYILDRHLGWGDIWSDTFVSRFIGDIMIPKTFDRYLIYSENVVARIVQRCVN